MLPYIRRKNMRRLKNIAVHWISLVDRAANQKQIVCKNIVGEISDIANSPLPTPHSQLIKSEAKHIVYGIVYAPESQDSQGDIADAETIEKASQEFMRNHNLHRIDKQHNFENQAAYVVENWIVRKGDELFPDEIGAWAMGIKVEDETLWQQCLDGEITGLSLYGEAAIETTEETDHTLFKKLYDILKKFFTTGSAGVPPAINNENPAPKETKMTEELKTEMTSIVKSTLNDLNTDLANIKAEITKLQTDQSSAAEIQKLKDELATLKDEITKSKSQNQDQTPETISFV